MATQKYMAFPLPSELQERLETIIQKIRNDEDKRQYANDLVNIISDLSDTAMDFFFIDIMKKLGVGSFTIAATQRGLNLGKKAVLSVGRKMIRKMKDEQLIMIIDFMEQSLITKPEDS